MIGALMVGQVVGRRPSGVVHLDDALRGVWIGLVLDAFGRK